MNKRVVIFDMDGVIFDTGELGVLLNTGIYPSMSRDESRALFRGNIHEELKKVTHPHVTETEEERANRIRTYQENKRAAPIFPGIKSFLEELAKDQILVLNTSAYSVNTHPLLDKVGISNLFSLIATKEFDTSKARKFGHIAKKFGTTPREMIFVTDTIGDIKEAQTTGVPTIAVTWGIHTRDEFEEGQYENLVGIVDNVEELKQLIDARS